MSGKEPYLVGGVFTVAATTLHQEEVVKKIEEKAEDHPESDKWSLSLKAVSPLLWLAFFGIKHFLDFVTESPLVTGHVRYLQTFLRSLQSPFSSYLYILKVSCKTSH